MPRGKVFLLHGYSVTDTATYGDLPTWLQEDGYAVDDINIGAYVSLDNVVTINDLSKAMQRAVGDKLGDDPGTWEKFNLITHSTGALIARNWLKRGVESGLFPEDRLPVKNLILAAPPNHGSRLAHHGKSMLNRVRQWNAVGRNILNGLELSSSLQWELNMWWLATFGKDLSTDWYADEQFFFSCLTGCYPDPQWYNYLMSATIESGSDNTVRPAAANLNMRYFHLDGTTDAIPTAPGAEITGALFRLYLEKSHYNDKTGIITSMRGDRIEKAKNNVYRDIADLLRIEDPGAYREMAGELKRRETDDYESFIKKEGPDPKKVEHQQAVVTKRTPYTQIAFRIHDDFGEPVEDSLIQLRYHSEKAGEGIHGNSPTGSIEHLNKAVRNVHKNQVNSNQFCFFLKTDEFTIPPGEKFCLVIEADSGTENLEIDGFKFTPPADFAVSRIVRENQTAYIDVTLPRTEAGNRRILNFYSKKTIDNQFGGKLNWGKNSLPDS